MRVETDKGSPIQLRGPYRARPVRFVGLHQLGEWRLKVYGITAAGGRPRRELTDAALSVATNVLPRPAQSNDRYGVGFLVVHDAADLCFVLVDWWQGENEIYQRLFSAELDNPADLRLHSTDAVGCVWELSVIDFERRAWIEDVLANPSGPDIELYMSRRFNADI
jgi:hypothetical protein